MKRWFLCIGIALLALGCSSTGEILQDFDGDGSLDADDCGPAEATIYPGASDAYGDEIDSNCDGIDGTDGDGDGYPGDSTAPAAVRDCNDADAAWYPGAADAVDGDGADTNCDGTDGVDGDGDGWASTASGGQDCDDDDPTQTQAQDIDLDGISDCAGDCVDTNNTIYPGADEVCDGKDSDCDGTTPEDEVDGDGDGSLACDDCDDADPLVERLDVDGDGITTCGGDCNDEVAQVNSYEADLFGDGLDTNCDGIDGIDADGDGFAGISSGGADCVDDDANVTPDLDGDGDGSTYCDDCNDSDPQVSVSRDLDGDGITNCDGDCLDSDPSSFPGAVELCDGIDNDCDGALPADEADADADGSRACQDCDDTDPDRETLDLDGDGVSTCAVPADCDDQVAQINPYESDLAGDGLDTNCDGVDGTDVDGDGYASAGSGGLDCDDSDLGVTPLTDADGDGDTFCGGDCDDTNPALNLGDADFDGFSTCTGDCDDNNYDTRPGASEVCDGLDNDCDGQLSAAESDSDGDGYILCEDCDDTDPALWGSDLDGDGYDPCTGDCDEQTTSVHFGAYDLPDDGVDQNCDGVDGTDADGDGYAGDIDSNSLVWDCNDDDLSLNRDDLDGDGYDSCTGDCDDGNQLVYPGSTEIWESPAQLLNTNCDWDLFTSLSAADATIVGEHSADKSGYSVSSAGDVDGDGLGDLLVGAPYNDEGGGSSSSAVDGAGKTYLFLGASITAGGTFDLTEADAAFVGENASDYSGYSVASAGDVDGDGLSDLLIGALGNADGGSLAGKSYLFLGSSIAGGGSFDLSAADASFVGENADDRSGVSVASAGDVDGDGLSDLLISAYGNDDGGSNAGKTYLFLAFSIAAGGTFNLSAADASFVGENQDDYSGRSVASAGDVDGDGLSDLLIGAYVNDDGGSNAGKSYLFLGSSITAGGTFDLSAADASFVGENAGDFSGYSVASAGDVDGDGLSDLLISAHLNDDGGTHAGKSYLFLASSIAAGGTFDLSAADASFVGENGGDYSGISVASAGDVDGDGLSDLLIGAYYNDDGGTYAGKSYLFFASSIAAGGTFDLSSADAAFVGENASDYSGTSVASAGDVDGDGLDDLFISAYGNDEGGSNAGKTYLLLSRFPTPDYAGLWAVAPATTYACGPGFVSAQLDHLVIDHVAPYATVAGMPELTMEPATAQPGLLEGGFITSATPDSFALTRTEPLNSGACTATWALTGSYTGPDTLSADFTATFTGACGDCTNQSFPVTATR